MLEDRGRGRYEVRCDRCDTMRETVATEIRDVRAQLLGLGWVETICDGKPRERWIWRCPTCAPRASSTFG